MASTCGYSFEIDLQLMDEEEYIARIDARREFIRTWQRMIDWDGDPPYYPKMIREGCCPFMDVGTIVYLVDQFDPRAVINPMHPNHMAHNLKFAAGQTQIASKRIVDKLSNNYWLHWAGVRPPIGVVCPNNYIWQIDAWAYGYHSKSGAYKNKSWHVTGMPEEGTLTVEGKLLTKNYSLRIEDGILYYQDRKVKI